MQMSEKNNDNLKSKEVHNLTSQVLCQLPSAGVFGLFIAPAIAAYLGENLSRFGVLKIGILSVFLLFAPGLFLPESINASANSEISEVEQIDNFIKTLKSDSWDVRRAAAKALGNLGEKATKALPELIRLLGDETENVRSASAWAIGRIGAKDRILELKEEFRTGTWQKKQGVIWVLGYLKAEEAIPLLRKGLTETAYSDDYDAKIRLASAWALDQLGEKASAAVFELIPNVSYRDGEVRRLSAKVLGNLGEKASAAVPELIQNLSDGNWEIRQLSVEILGQIGVKAKKAVPTLLEALVDVNTKVRQASGEALKKILINVEKEYKGLEQLDLFNLEQEVRQLGELGKKADWVMPLLFKTLQSGYVNIRRGSAEAISGIGNKEVIPELLEIWSSGGWQTKQGAIWALGDLEAEEAIPLLRKGLMEPNRRYEDYDEKIRLASAEALGKLGEKALTAMHELVINVSNDDESIRKASAETLGNLGEKVSAAVPELIQNLSNGNWDIRKVSVEILGKIGVKAKAAVPKLLEALVDANADVRQASEKALKKIVIDVENKYKGLEKLDLVNLEQEVRQLGELGKTEDWVMPLLFKTLQSGYVNIRRGSAEAISGIGNKEVIPELLEIWSSGGWQTKQGAIWALGDLEAEEAIPLLRKGLMEPNRRYEDYDEKIRLASAEALGKLGEKALAAMPELVMNVSNDDKNIRNTCAKILGNLGDKISAAVPELIQNLSNGNSEIRKLSVDILGHIGVKAKEAVPTLLKALVDANTEVRQASRKALKTIVIDVEKKYKGLEKLDLLKLAQEVRQLGELGKKADWVMPLLLKTLQSSDENIRRASAEAISEIGKKDVIPKLQEIWGSGGWETKQGVIWALGYLKAEEAIQLFRQGLEETAYYDSSNNAKIRLASAWALDQLGEKASKAVPELIQNLSHGENYIRKASVEALGSIGKSASAAVPMLIEKLADNSREVRIASTEALKNIGAADKSDIKDLIALLSHENARIREGALEALGKMGAAASSAVPQLIKALGHEDEAIRDINKAALEQIGKASTAELPMLIDLLSDKDARVKQGVLEVLGNMGIEASRAIPYLITGVTDENVVIRSATENALEKIGVADKKDLGKLLDLLNHKDAKVRQAVIEVLGNMGKEAISAIPYLKKQLEDNSNSIKHAATVAIDKIVSPEPPHPVSKPIITEPEEINKGVVPEAYVVPKPITPQPPEPHSVIEYVAYTIIAILLGLIIITLIWLRIRNILEKMIENFMVKEEINTQIRILRRGEQSEKITASEQLVEIGEASIPYLNRLLEHKDGWVRYLTITALDELGEHKNILNRLIRELKTADTDLKLEIVKTLGEFGPKAQPAIPDLVKEIAAPKLEGELSGNILRALEQIGPPSKKEHSRLRTLLKQVPEPTKVPVIQALWQRNMDENEPPKMMLNLVKALNIPLIEVWEHQKGIKRIRYENKHIALLLQDLESSDNMRKILALSKLADTERLPENAIKQIIRVLKPEAYGDNKLENLVTLLIEELIKAITGILSVLLTALKIVVIFPPIKRWITQQTTKIILKVALLTPPNVALNLVDKYLENLPEEMALELLKYLDHPNWEYRQKAIFILGSVRENSSNTLSNLVKKLADPNPEVAWEAKCALIKIGGINVANQVSEILKESDKARARLLATLVLKGLCQEARGARLELTHALQDQDRDVRRMAYSSIGEIGLEANELGVEAKRGLEQEGDWRVKASAYQALLKMRAPKEELQQLIGASLKERILRLEDLDEKVWIKVEAISALAQNQASRAIPELVKSLHDANWQVRDAAAESLGKIGAIEAEGELTKLLNDEHEQVKKSVQKALTKIANAKAAGEKSKPS
jgi:HEAT repeat protein